MKLFKHFNLLCLLFGHDWDYYNVKQYTTMNNGRRYLKKSKRRRKKEVVITFRECERCGKRKLIQKVKKYH